MCLGVPGLVVERQGAADELPQALVEFAGIYPTVAELTGTGAPKGIDTKSFAAYAKNPEHGGPAAAP